MVRNIDTVVIDALTPEVRVARLSQNRLVDLDIERPNRTIRAGDVILARVKAVVPSAGGAFMEIGDTSDGFLPFPEKTDRPSFHEGEAVIVQVRNEAMAEKGARLTDKVALTGRYAVYTPGRPGANVSRKGGDPVLAESLKSAVSGHIPEGDGAVIRTAAFKLHDNAAAACAAEIQRLSGAWQNAQTMVATAKPPNCLIPAPDVIPRTLQSLETPDISRIVVEGAETFGRVKQELVAFGSGLLDRLELYQGVPGVFEVEGIEAQLEAALAPPVPLPSGGSLYIQETPACTTVDVDTDASRGGGRGRDIIGKTNLEAAEALAGELRRRNLSGNIVVDFIRDRDRDAGKALLDGLTAFTSDDPVPVDILGFTRLGLVELVRRRRSASLADVLLDRSTGVASILPSTETLAYRTLRHVLRAAHEAPGRKLEVRAHRSVIDLLQGNLRPALDAVYGRVGVEVRLTGDDAIAQDKLDVFSAA